MKKTILVVDDEENIRELYKEEFEEMGYSVFDASCGEDALYKIDKHKPDLVLLDIRLPDMDGFEVSQVIKIIEPSIPIILVSAYEEYKIPDKTDIHNAFITKSADMAPLKNIVKDILETNRVRPMINQPTNTIDNNLPALIHKIKHLFANKPLEKYRKNIESKLDDITGNDMLLDKYKKIIESSSDKFSPNKTDIVQFGRNIKSELHQLKKNCQNIMLLLNKLLMTSTHKDLIHAIKYAQNAILYSALVIENSKVIFLDMEPNSAVVNVKNMVNELIELSTEGRNKYTIRRNYGYKGDMLLNVDIVRLLIFVLLKNINDYLLDDHGYLSISVSKKKNQPSPEISLSFANSTLTEKIDRKKKIMVVDDTISIQELFKTELTESGYKVLLASNGYDCLDLLRDETVDLIVLDLKMVGMEGFEVLETIRRNKKSINIPVIIYSGFDVVLTREFNKVIARYHPVKTVLKSENQQEIMMLINNLIKQPLRPFNFKDLYGLDLESSIMQNNVFKTGLYSVKKATYQLGGSIEFIDSNADGENNITIKLPMSLSTDFDILHYEEKQKISQLYLNMLIDYTRHDLKNKLLPIQIDFNKIDTITMNNESRVLVNDVIKTVDNCIVLLEKIKKLS